MKKALNIYGIFAIILKFIMAVFILVMGILFLSMSKTIEMGAIEGESAAESLAAAFGGALGVAFTIALMYILGIVFMVLSVIFFIIAAGYIVNYKKRKQGKVTRRFDWVVIIFHSLVFIWSIEMVAADKSTAAIAVVSMLFALFFIVYGILALKYDSAVAKAQLATDTGAVEDVPEDVADNGQALDGGDGPDPDYYSPYQSVDEGEDDYYYEEIDNNKPFD